MADIKSKYGTEAQAITCTLANLAAGAARESAAVDNRTNLYVDALVVVKIQLAAGTPGADKRVYVWAAGTVDVASPTWPDAVTGADAAITLNNPRNVRLLGTIEAPTSAGTFSGGPWSIAQLFGQVPEEWSIIIENQTNIALGATEGNMKKQYQGVWGTIV